MQTKQHFITNLISCLQIWVPRPSWPDPTRPAHPKFSDPTRPDRPARPVGRATLGLRSRLRWHSETQTTEQHACRRSLYEVRPAFL